TVASDGFWKKLGAEPIYESYGVGNSRPQYRVFYREQAEELVNSPTEIIPAASEDETITEATVSDPGLEELKQSKNKKNSNIGGKMAVVTATALGTLSVSEGAPISDQDLSQMIDPNPIVQYVDSVPNAMDLLDNTQNTINKYNEETSRKIINDFLGKLNNYTIAHEDIIDLTAILKTEGLNPEIYKMAIWYLELAFDKVPAIITHETISSLMDMLTTETLDLASQKDASSLLIKILSNKIDLITPETVPFFEWLFENKIEVLLDLRRDKEPSETEVKTALAKYWDKLGKTLEEYPPNGSECHIDVQILRDFGYNDQEIKILSSQLEGLIKELDLQKLTSLPEIERVKALGDLIKIKLNLFGGNSFFDLPDIFNKGDGCCVMAAQLGYILGRAIGLPIRIISVKNERHVTNIIEFQDSDVAFVDFSAHKDTVEISEKFNLEDKYYKDKAYWKLKNKEALFNLDPNLNEFERFENVRFCNTKDVFAGRINNKEKLFKDFANIISKVELSVDFTKMDIDKKGNSKEELNRIADIEKAISISPNDINLYKALADLYLDQASILRHRLENYDKYKNLPPKEQVEEWVSYNSERSAKVIELYEKILELEPDYIDIYLYLIGRLKIEVNDIDTLLKNTDSPEELKDNLNNKKENIQNRIEELKKKIKEIQKQMLDSLEDDESKTGSMIPLFPVGFFGRSNRSSYDLEGQAIGSSLMDALNVLVWIKEAGDGEYKFILDRDNIDIVGVNGDSKDCTDKYILERLKGLKPNQVMSIMITDLAKKEELKEKLKGMVPKDKLFFTELKPESEALKQWNNLSDSNLSYDFKSISVSNVIENKDLIQELSRQK
ncbi:MAG: hypothetical protein ABIG92_06090, partial [Candidatus Omnitrophota bacterium]